MAKKLIKHGEKIGLKPTQAERELLLEGLPILPSEVCEPIRSTPPGKPAMLTLDDLDDLAGHVAAEANHAEDRKLKKKLDAIFRKIEHLLETHTDEEPPKTLKIEDAQKAKLILDQSVQLAKWAAKFLVAAEQQGIKTKPIERFSLPAGERAVLAMLASTPPELKEKLVKAGGRFTVADVAVLTMAAAETLPDAEPLQQVALILIAKSLMDCLEAEFAGPGKSAATKRGNEARLYQLKVTLKDLEPPIWRRLQVPDCTLGGLHEVLQIAMGWHNSHMHQFVVDGRYYGRPVPGDFDMEVEDEEGTTLSQIIAGRKKARIVYEYDFGDGWQHEVVFEKTVEPEPNAKYPRCTEGARACPPEDVGGPWGYMDFLAAMADPKHESHREMKDWIGGRFDPEGFALDRVNRDLRQLR